LELSFHTGTFFTVALWSLVMRTPSQPSPALVPDLDRAVFLVLEDFGLRGRAWCETDESETKLEAVLANFLRGEFRNPVQVVGFNAADGWAIDVSAGMAQVIRRTCGEQGEDVPELLKSFVDKHDPPKSGRSQSIATSSWWS
jgi:hypothetical protein